MTHGNDVALEMAPVQAAVAHSPATAPEALAHRVAELLADADAGGRAVDRHLEAAERAVARLLRDQCTSRAAALDLLAADALATYAFELAADEPERIPELAARAMARFAALAAVGDAHQAAHAGARGDTPR